MPRSRPVYSPEFTAMEIERPTMHCRTCSINQFVNRTRTCVRCKNSLDAPVSQQAVVINSIPVPKPTLGVNYWLPLVLTGLRVRVGLSQGQLANKMKVPRQYINKVENGHAVPVTRTLARYTHALGFAPAHVVQMTEFLVFGS